MSSREWERSRREVVDMDVGLSGCCEFCDCNCDCDCDCCCGKRDASGERFMLTFMFMRALPRLDFGHVRLESVSWLMLARREDVRFVILFKVTSFWLLSL